VYSDLAARVERTTLLRAIRAFNEAVNNYRGGWQPQLALELALVESVRGGSTEAAAPIAVGAARPPADIEALVRRLLAEQSGTPAPAQPVPEPEVSVPPGTPPVIEVLLIRERWNDMLKVLFQINKTAPEVVQHLRPLRVDGNIVTLGTDNQIYFGRFQPSDRHGAGRIKAIEKALHEIHALELRIKVLLVKDLNSELTLHTPSPDLLSDPLVATGLELGGQIKSSD
jgi:DNA polymerase III subunit gamma/tau